MSIYCDCGSYVFHVWIPKIRVHIACDKCGLEYVINKNGKKKRGKIE